MLIKPNFLAQLFYYVGSYHLLLEDGQIKRVLKTLWIFKRKDKFLTANKITVFDTDHGILGKKLETSYKAGGPVESTIKVAGLNKNQLSQINEYILKNGAQIMQNAGVVKPNFLTQLLYYVGNYKLILLEDGQLKRVLKTLWIFKRKDKFLTANKITVFDADLGILGQKLVTSYKAGDTDQNTIKVVGLNKNKIGQINEYILKNGAQILQNSGIIKPNLIAQLFYYVGSYKLILLEDGQLKRVLKTLWIFKRKDKFLTANKIIVFDTDLGILGNKLITGYKAGGFDNKTIKAIGLNKNKITKIRDYIQKNGAQILQAEGEMLKTLFPLFSPSRWLSFRERIIIGDKGITHVKKGWFKKRQSFLPYESINLYCYNGVMYKDVLLLGDTTISLVEKLSNDNNEKLKKVLSQKGITSTKGRKYLPALLSFKRGLSPDVLITTDKGVLFKSKKLIGGQKNIFLNYNEIIDFKKIGWHRLFAPISIQGRRVDARQGEGGNVNIIIKGIAFYRWCTLFFFDGSLKSTLESRGRQ